MNKLDSMTYIQCEITNKCKYYTYHIIVFIMFILTIIKINRFGNSQFTGFILFTIIIQIILCCCVNTNNHFMQITSLDYLFIVFSQIVTSCVFTPYIFLNLEHILKIKTISFYSIYFICMLVYIIIVVFCINSFYLSGSPYREYICFCYKPKPALPALPTVTIYIPNINIPTKPITYRNAETCLICVEPRKKEEIKTLKCSHTLCIHCIQKIGAVNNLCPYCKQDINISIN